ncbi:MAG: glycosyltransferase N-terminal domain-containing protein [Pseudomonadota bacterium]
MAGKLAARFIKFVYRTSTVKADPADYEDVSAAVHPFILGLWHGQFMLVSQINTRGLPVKIMVARHGDAAILGDALNHLGLELIRGAGAGRRGRDRGGAQALRQAVRALSEGNTVAMTADVPPGPARQVGEGIIMLARLSGRPILPIAVATSRFRTLRTWSRFTINLPFSTLGIACGEPLYVPRGSSDEQREALRVEFEARMNDATRRAYALAGADMQRATPRVASNMHQIEPAKPGTKLAIYRGLTSAARAVAPLVLKRREKAGKEDPARQGERYGFAGVKAPPPDRPVIWIHAASVGEFNAALPLIQRLQAERPDLFVLATTGTRTSAQVAAERLGSNACHQFIPLDAETYIERFLDHWSPQLAILTESEIWPNLILSTAQRNIPLALINARMSARSFNTWRRHRSVAAPLFGRFALVLAQNEKLARRFGDLGCANAIAVGNLKIDAPALPVDADAQTSLIAAMEERPAFLAASTHEGEDEIIGETHRLITREEPSLLTIIAPRHPQRADRIAQTLEAQGLRVDRRSSGALPQSETDVYLADTIGEMGLFFASVPIAFLGGSLVEHGGQNPVEAIRHGAVTLTGPHVHNFQDTYRVLLRTGATQTVSDAPQIAAAVIKLLGDEAALASNRTSSATALQALSGALDRSVDALRPLLPPPNDKALRRAS